MRVQTALQEKGGRRWIWIAGALLPLALVGCGGQQTSSTNAPQEQVAGDRQEDEVMRLVTQAGLPNEFAFGGRMWRPHQVHRVGGDQATTGSGTDAGTGTTPEAAGNTTGGTSGAATGTTGTSGTTGTTGSDSAVGTGTGGDTSAATGGSGTGSDMGGFVPVADLEVQGHQIYRRSDADEAVTDNIYLRAEGVSGPAGMGGTGASTGTTGAEGATGTEGATGATGTTGPTAPGEGATGATGTAGAGTSGTGTEGATGTAAGNAAMGGTAGSTEMVFIEYEASGDMMSGMETSQVVEAANLPQTITFQGKKLNAQGMEGYDADTFDDLKPLPQEIQGHKAYQGEDKNVVFLMGEVTSTPAAGGTGATGATGDTAAGGTTGTNAPGEGATGSTGAGTTGAEGTTGTGTGDTAAGGVGTEGGSSATMAGPVFVRYAAGEAAGSGGTGTGGAGTGGTGTGGTTAGNAPGSGH